MKAVWEIAHLCLFRKFGCVEKPKDETGSHSSGTSPLECSANVGPG